jgi:hypothetical protein
MDDEAALNGYLGRRRVFYSIDLPPLEQWGAPLGRVEYCQNVVFPQRLDQSGVFSYDGFNASRQDT